MSWHLTIGPPGSGRTSAMVAVTRAACRDGKRVWYVGLPAQRASITRRITDDDFTALGLEVMSAQQMYYRLLTGSGSSDVRPLVIGSGRLVRVAEALSEVSRALPSPGEARLFAAAIAEAKRFAVTPDDLTLLGGGDTENARLVDVYRAYQRAMDGSWDYDDVRLAAVAMVEGATEAGPARSAAADVPADVIIVDGLREVGPLELRVLKALATWREVHLTLPAAPEGELATATLPPGPAARIERHLAPNPVAEARWVMRSLKSDLARGSDPLELAVIAPPGRASAVIALADEYGVPIMDETPVALADTAAGRTLLDLLELAESPTPSRLLAVPELAPLAARALDLGVTGQDAMALLATELGLTARWREWSRRLTVDGDPVEWAREVVTAVLPLGQPDLPDGFAATALGLAQESARLGSGAGFQTWWAALLRDSRSSHRQPGGVALLDANLASGRRFEKVYIMGATEGAYGAFEREDYFTPEEWRGLAPETVRAGTQVADGAAAAGAAAARAARSAVGLPRRLQGRDQGVIAELLSRAPHMVVTAPAADQSGLLVADAALLGADPCALPDLPAGSRLELAASRPYRPVYDRADLGEPTAEFLRQYRDCALRAWGRRALPTSRRASDADPPAWLALRSAMIREPRLSPERLGALTEGFPEAAAWLREHESRLLFLNYSQRIRDVRTGVVTVIDAGERAALRRRPPRTAAAEGGQKLVIYRFAEPHPAAEWRWANEQLRDRWSEYLAAEVMLRHPTMAPDLVEFVVWPIYGAPIVVEDSRNEYARRRIGECHDGIRAQVGRFASGDLTPTPGHVCRGCELHQVCRVRELA